MPSLRSLLSAGALILAATFVFQACGKQGEAMRCERANGNEDCEPGLECVERPLCCSDTICCPKTGGSTSECLNVATQTPGTDAATDTADAGDTGAADTGATDTGATDTGATDTGTDDAAEAG